jgi:dTDP-glucose 4,6-dehydratase
MRWLVVGASSFSGSNFVSYLIERNHEIWHWSLREPSVLPIPKVDVVINFAALNVVAPSWAHWKSYLRVNVLQTGILFDAMVDSPPELYIHVSTPEVYGNVSGLIKEDHPHNPSTPYAVSRAASEMLLKTYQKQYGLKAIITRACNVYGPGQQHYRLIPKVIACIKKGIKFPLEGGGKSRRAWLYIDDYCRMLDLIAQKGAAPVIHLTTDTLHPVREVVGAICSQLGARDIIEDLPERPGKDDAYQLHSTSYWGETTSLRSGISKTITWMIENWESIKDKPMEYEVRP